MNLETLHVEHYRSVKDLTLEVGQLNVVLGPNGSGKSNLYKALSLLPAACEGRLARTLLREGGMPSAMWAGPRPTKKKAFRLRIQVTLDDFVFDLSCGVAPPSESPFRLDPEVKEESLLGRGVQKPARWMERKNAAVTLRASDGSSAVLEGPVDPAESVISQIRDPHRYPQLSRLQQILRQWRFYHHFRTDVASPLRRLQPGVRTPVLAADGSDLGAALATIFEAGQGDKLESVLGNAFPGQSLIVSGPDGQFGVALQDETFQRPFLAHELSDGTLQFLCLLAVLLSPRPPLLLALNEPETSLHPRLYEPLARLVVDAASRSQVWLTTHARDLAQHIRRLSGVRPLEIEKTDGETLIAGQSRFGYSR